MLHHPAFVLEGTTRGAYAVVRATGELDIAAVPRLREAIAHAARRSPRVVVDLHAVSFMDTFALRALVRLSEEAAGSGEWALHCVPGVAIQRLLDLAGAREHLRWIAPEQLAD